jgi:ribosomal-protein-alanine N-acetyltransferase
MSGTVSAAAGPEPATRGLVVDRLRWWDLEAVQALEDVLFGADAWTPGQFWSELARVPQSRWYVAARRDGALVGYAGIFLIPPEADVQTIAVAAAEQGRGTGRVLLQSLLARAAGAGARVVHLEVQADNVAALGLYAGVGFTMDGRRRDYYGRGRDALLMSWTLPPDDRGAADG